MGNQNAPDTEWDAEEQAEETSTRTYPQFLAYAVRQLWPLFTLAAVMAGVAIWFDHHP
jgi:hypothetical protein